MWLTSFKKAIILKELETLSHLIDEMPHFESLLEMEEAAYLLNHAKTLIEAEKSTAFASLKQIKKTLNFLKATENSPVSSINFKL
ncbi:MAG: hypothetical protein Q8N01_10840 [Sulfuricurvum sp.]|nr:hypothetical protein [Sulfuricurvum sp.]MDP3022696.1 hypothetical protein [Sulfuricurvum sp.]MDP3120902.1 hypothetical protein [Sulfuricurvum sp.]